MIQIQSPMLSRWLILLFFLDLSGRQIEHLLTQWLSVFSYTFSVSFHSFYRFSLFIIIFFSHFLSVYHCFRSSVISLIGLHSGRLLLICYMYIQRSRNEVKKTKKNSQAEAVNYILIVEHSSVQERSYRNLMMDRIDCYQNRSAILWVILVMRSLASLCVFY